MGYYEQKRDNLALPRIQQFGSAMFLVATATTFNELTGETTAGKQVLQAVYGLVTKQNKIEASKVDGVEASVHQREQKTVMITATGLTTAPTPEMQLKDGTTYYEIRSVMPFAPGGVVVYYELEVLG